MMKKLVALAATALFSLNASASYVQYDFAATSGLSGYFIQHEQDRSIAYYDFFAESYPYSHFQPSGPWSNISWTVARYNNTGPSLFKVFNAITEAYYTEIAFNFSATGTPGTYTFTSYFTAVEDAAWPDDPWADDLKPAVHYYNGVVKQSAVSPEFAEYIDWYRDFGMYPDGLNIIVPRLNAIPEPTSIALLALGVAGLAGASRRRKAVK